MTLLTVDTDTTELADDSDDKQSEHEVRLIQITYDLTTFYTKVIPLAL